MNGNLKVINKIIANDVTLSAKAKGILSFMVCFPDDELFNMKSLISNFSDGRESIRNGLKELELKGYVKTKQERDELGKFIRSDWIVVNGEKEIEQ